jgi:formylglycine-generating enzyme required for sulfatase activity
MKKIITLALLFLAFTLGTEANNIQTSNVSLSGQNTALDYTLINYDISWENSWRTSNNESNYDGTWIFAKFRKKNTSLWLHCTINYGAGGSAAASGHTQAAGSTIQTSNDSKGLWQYRTADGIGNVNWTGNKLQWNYGVDGVLDTDSVEVKLFAVEMVYIPQGAYNLGSGGAESYHFRDGAVNTYYPITSENAVTMGTLAGNLWAEGAGYIIPGTLPAAFPKGFNAFWIMKYESSQQQYVDFLNNLNLTDAAALNNGVYTGTHPNLVAPNPERAAYISPMVTMAWLDWAAMRPFTELEYEKACRGANIIPMPGEFAWGNVTATLIDQPTTQGTTTETWAIGNCHYWYYYPFNLSVPTEPMRCGALATATSTRTSSGATYYGVMEMSGNLWESCVTLANAAGLAFNANHGDGKIAITGSTHNVANWPISSTGSGLGFRGGGFGYSTPGYVDYIAVSGRYSAGQNSTISSYAARGARSAQ